MNEKKTATVFFLVAFLTGMLPAAETRFELGGASGWDRVVRLENLRTEPGRRGRTRLVLADRSPAVHEDTDLLLSFDETPFRDLAGKYRVSGRQERNGTLSVRGGGAGMFEPGTGGLILEALPGALFRPGTSWNAFTIEFWAYPVSISDGEILFQWQGTRFENGDAVTQEIIVALESRRLNWEFINFFLPPGRETDTTRLSGRRALVPRTWQHHMIRFSPETGVLEYLLDGVPEEIIHTTPTGREGPGIAFPYIGSASGNSLEIAGRFTGMIDELHISRSFLPDPELSRVTDSVGIAETGPIDMGREASRVREVLLDSTAPGYTETQVFLRTGDSRDRFGVVGDWTRIDPGTSLGDGFTGRYFQIRLELLPDGSGLYTPAVSRLELFYERNTPPPPPEFVTAVALDGAVQLSWSEVLAPDLEGYLVYYGTRPGRYFGEASSLGPSPIDAGNTRQVVVDGLENDRLYYFAIMAYDAAGPTSDSIFSRETAARPTRRR